MHRASSAHQDPESNSVYVLLPVLHCWQKHVTSPPEAGPCIILCHKEPACGQSSGVRLQAVQQGGRERVSIGTAGGTFPILRPDMLAGPPAALPGARRSRLLCEWTAHPTGLLLAAGVTLS